MVWSSWRDVGKCPSCFELKKLKRRKERWKEEKKEEIEGKEGEKMVGTGRGRTGKAWGKEEGIARKEEVGEKWECEGKRNGGVRKRKEVGWRKREGRRKGTNMCMYERLRLLGFEGWTTCDMMKNTEWGYVFRQQSIWCKLSGTRRVYGDWKG